MEGMPYTLGTNYMSTKMQAAYNLENSHSKNRTIEDSETIKQIETYPATVIGRMGGIELTVRISVMLLGPIIEKSKSGFFSLIYSAMSLMAGLICIFLTIEFQAFTTCKSVIQILFLLLPIPMGVMNALVLPAGYNIFGKELNNAFVFPYSCTFLALGFSSGPIVFSTVSEYFNMELGFYVAGIGAILGATLFLILGIFQLRKGIYPNKL